MMTKEKTKKRSRDCQEKEEGKGKEKTPNSTQKRSAGESKGYPDETRESLQGLGSHVLTL
jgi:hypothetical protein